MSSTDVETQTDAAVEEPLEEQVVDPALVFTTPKKDHLPSTTAAQRTFPFELDGETYWLVKPRKWEDSLLALEEASARRASRADRIWQGRDFLQTVLTPESLHRLTARARDDQDDFEILDIFDLLPQIIRVLAAKDDKGGNAAPKAKQPARARARARTTA